MIVYGRPVIEDAFQQTLGRLAPAVLQGCIDEFVATYPVLGTEEAFKSVLTEKAPTVDSSDHDRFYLRFEGALTLAQAERKEEERRERERQEQLRKEASTEAEKRQVREEAERLKREVSDKTAEFRRVQGDMRDVNRDILAAAGHIRQLARESEFRKADPVTAALEALDEITGKSGEVERLVKDSSDIAKDVAGAARNGDTAEIDGSIMAVESILAHLTDIRDIRMPEMQNAVEDAIRTANDDKVAQEEVAAIKDAVTKAEADLDAMDGADGIVARVKAAVHQYKKDVIAQTGTPPPTNPADTNSPDRFAVAASDALREAKRAHSFAVRAAAGRDRVGAEGAARQVADQKDAAQAALDGITRWSSVLTGQKELEEARDIYVSTTEKKKEEAKAKKGRWLDHWYNQLRVLLAAALAVWLGFPDPLRTYLIVAAVVVLIMMVVSWVRKMVQTPSSEDSNKVDGGKAAVGLYAGIVGVAVVWIFVAVPLLSMAPDNDRSLIPSDPTPTATSRAQQVGSYPTQAELDAEATATAEASATEAANNP